MSALILQAALYTRYSHPFRAKRGSLKDCWQVITTDLLKHCETLGLSYGENIPHFLCSTINGTSFSTGQITWPAIKKLFDSQMPLSPLLYLDAYECASWGYALRYFYQHPTYAGKRIIISILDVNFFDFEFWVESRHWGKSGFGLTTLLMGCCNEISSVLVTGCAQGSNPVTEFAFALRDTMKKNHHYVGVPPFFPKNAQDILYRVVDLKNTLGDQHAKWGHSFGSDPWISLIEYQNSTQNPHDQFLLSSLAFNGYFVIAKVDVDQHAKFAIYL